MSGALQWGNGLEEFLGIVVIGADIVIPEDEGPPWHVADFVDYSGHRAVAHPTLVHLGNRAVFAGEGATPSGDGDALPIPTPLDEIPSRSRHVLQIR